MARYKRALLEKDIRTAMALSDAHGLRNCLARAENCGQGLEELVATAEAALHELSHMDAARSIVNRSLAFKTLRSFK